MPRHALADPAWTLRHCTWICAPLPIRSQLRPAIEGIGALPGFDLRVFADDRQALSVGKPFDGSLGLLCRGQSAAVVGSRLEGMRQRFPLTTRHTTVCRLVVAKSEQ